MKDRQYAPELDLHYSMMDNQAVFEDGTVYSIREMIFLSKAPLSSTDYKAIHLVKRVFDGEIVEAGPSDEKYTISTTPPKRVQYVPGDALTHIGDILGELPILKNEFCEVRTAPKVRKTKKKKNKAKEIQVEQLSIFNSLM